MPVGRISANPGPTGCTVAPSGAPSRAHPAFSEAVPRLARAVTVRFHRDRGPPPALCDEARPKLGPAGRLIPVEPVKPEDFQQPEMRATYANVEPYTRALLTESDRTLKDGQRLSDFVDGVRALGMHGAVAAVALTWCSLDDLARVLGVRTATTIALVSRVVP